MDEPKLTSIIEALRNADYLDDGNSRIIKNHSDGTLYYEVRREQRVINGCGFDDLVFSSAKGEEEYRIPYAVLTHPTWQVIEAENK